MHAVMLNGSFGKVLSRSDTQDFYLDFVDEKENKEPWVKGFFYLTRLLFGQS